MIRNDAMHQEVLIDPYVSGQANRLKVVSGYATFSMAEQHLSDLLDAATSLVRSSPPAVELTIGMTSRGVLYPEHELFVALSQSQALGSGTSKRPVDFRCGYLPSRGVDSHEKLYLWELDGEPVRAFAGSANYTFGGFAPGRVVRRQGEVLFEVDPRSVSDLVADLTHRAIDCLHADVVSEVEFVAPTSRSRRARVPYALTYAAESTGYQALESFELSLLDSNGQMYNAGGINWGYASNGKLRGARDGYEMYIHVPHGSAAASALPPTGRRFLVEMDDGATFICVREGQAGKQLTTAGEKKSMGRYIRERLGVPDGRLLPPGTFESYGRTSVSLSKVSDTFFLGDFSV